MGAMASWRSGETSGALGLELHSICELLCGREELTKSLLEEHPALSYEPSPAPDMFIQCSFVMFCVHVCFSSFIWLFSFSIRTLFKNNFLSSIGIFNFFIYI